MSQVSRKSPEKAARALELAEKGIETAIIAQRLGTSHSYACELIQKARARREQEAPQQ
jgi:orotate phosphoribosyltransferase-like protein